MSLQDYLEIIENKENREFFSKIMIWVKETYPELNLAIKWNQPMFIKDGAFIISFNASKKYISVSIEKPLLKELKDTISRAGYEVLNMVFHIKYTDSINTDLLSEVIDYVLNAKKDSDGFWL